MTTEFSVFLMTGGAGCLCSTRCRATVMCAFLGFLTARALFPVTIGIVHPSTITVGRSNSCKSSKSSFYLCVREVFTTSAMVVSCYAGREIGLRVLFSNCINQSSVSMTTEFSVFLMTGGAGCLCSTRCRATVMCAFLGFLTARALFPVTIGIVHPSTITVGRSNSCKSSKSSFYLCVREVFTTSAMVVSCYAGREIGLRVLFSNRFNQSSVGMSSKFSVLLTAHRAFCFCRTSSNATRMSAFLGFLTARALFPVTIGIVHPLTITVGRCFTCKSIKSGFNFFFCEILTAVTVIMSCHAGRELGLRVLFSNCINQSSVSMTTEFSVFLMTGGAGCLCSTRCRATVMCAFLGFLTARALFPVTIGIVHPSTITVGRSNSCKSSKSSFYLCVREVFTTSAMVVSCYAGREIGLRVLFSNCINQSSVSMTTEFSVFLMTGGAGCLCSTRCRATVMCAFLGFLTARALFPVTIGIVHPSTITVGRSNSCKSSKSSFYLCVREVFTTSAMVVSCYAGGKLGLCMFLGNRRNESSVGVSRRDLSCTCFPSFKICYRYRAILILIVFAAFATIIVIPTVNGAGRILTAFLYADTFMRKFFPNCIDEIRFGSDGYCLSGIF